MAYSSASALSPFFALALDGQYGFVIQLQLNNADLHLFLLPRINQNYNNHSIFKTCFLFNTVLRQLDVDST